ncbi:Hypothetical protein POVN_LOCUS367 [uncultured virus]|nr:Hypothetical protein POVN_LOCUS367 [uncultured virus]
MALPLPILDDVPPLPPVDVTNIHPPVQDRYETYEGERIEWEDRKTCWISLNKQGGIVWKRLRIGAITMSMISKIAKRVPRFMQTPPDELARQICGLSEPYFPPEALARMNVGSKGEPILREWDAKELGVVIKEVGIGVYKKDPRFRGSMDGDINESDFCEYKIPERMYRQLIEFIEAIKKGYTPPPSEHSHIFNSHYDQMIGNAEIHGKQRCNYVVCAASNSTVYRQWVPADPDHWNNCLYPAGVTFYNTYVEPLLRKHKIRRIDPCPDTPVHIYKA